MARRLTVSGYINGVDDETFGSNEYGSANYTQETILDGSVPRNVLSMECRWGGECRVELVLAGEALSNGDVRVNGTAKLFEGTTESTGDLDGQRDFVVLVPRGKNTSYSGRVNNDDEGGDYADIKLTFSNALVEDESIPILKNKIIVLSDIHIGTNIPTVWYQKELHQPYLVKILEYVIENAASIQELVLLGDIVDFWTYPPSVRPPSFAEIIADHPDIFSSNGMLSKVLNALNGNVTYVRGNHDINITQDDLNLIQNPQGYTIKLSPDDIYFPLGSSNRKIVCTHGHLFTMFNAPDENTQNAPLPVGHFVTRSVAYMMSRKLNQSQTVADLPDQGAPNGINLASLMDSINPSITETLLNYITSITSMPQDMPILLPNGQKTTIQEAKNIYSSLWTQWVARYGGETDGELVAAKAAIADFDGTYMGWFAQKLALECGADLIVVGHTHTPKLGLTEALVNYANSGFECPSKPDFDKKPLTFIEIDVNNCQASLLQVTRENKIKPYIAQPDSVIASTSADYSCYVIIDNTKGNSDLMQAGETVATHGHYVVAPPKQIGIGQKGRFWIQDYPGIYGSAGQVSFNCRGSLTTFTYSCPFIGSNSCSPHDFYTKSDSNWGSLNQVSESGHPFFVKFVI